MIYLRLFWSFLQIGLFSIGGGYAAMPLIQAQVVDGYAWLSLNEFVDLITIAEMTPGPIAVNAATFVGLRIAGFGGAVVATLGCITPSLFLVSLLSYVYRRYKNLRVLQSVLASLRPAVVALIASAGLTILLKVVFNGQAMALSSVDWVGVGLFAAALTALRRLKWNPILVMVLCGAVGLALGVLTGA